MSTIRRLRRKMALIPKVDWPEPPPYKYNQLPEDQRNILNRLFDNYSQTSNFAADLGLTQHKARKALAELYDSGILRIVTDNVRANGQIHPESHLCLEPWYRTANTFTLI